MDKPVYILCRNIHCSKYLKDPCAFGIDHNTNALIAGLTATVGLIRRKHVCPVISLVTDQGWCFLMKMKFFLSRNLQGTLYVNFAKNTPFFKTKFKDDIFNQTPQYHHFCTFRSFLVLQKLLD